MSYFLSEFSGITLPLLEATQQIGTPRLDVQATPLASGGSRRLHGSDRRPRPMMTVTASGDIDGADWATVAVGFDVLRAAVGTYGKLWRDSKDAAGAREWTWAELLGVDADNTADYVLYQPVGLAFALFHPVWYSATETVLTFTDLYDATAGDMLLMGVMGATPGSAVPMVWFNSGDVPLTNLLLTLTSGTGTVTAFTVNNSTTSYSFSWAGSLTSGQVLIIDTGAMSITKVVGGVSTGVYSQFTPPSNKSQWMELAPGANSVSVTIADTATDDSTKLEVSYFSASA